VALDFVPAGDDLETLDAINRMVNAVRYIPDEENWGAPDHWATPGEFYRRSGDCEDFAIAKYVALKALGFDPSRMRIVVLVDEELRKHHAVLMVDSERGRMILDNQIAQVVRDSEIKHYRPIYSINEEAWWLHVEIPRKRLIALGNP
jgi:predicted transglutaminase-like cysteine proteinase